MNQFRGSAREKKSASPSCGRAETSCRGSSAATRAGADSCPITWFGNMVDHCYDYVQNAKENGRQLVGILCEYTPREIIMAADAVPVSLCGGSAAMIPEAEKFLPANLCPLIKSTFGYSVNRANPFLEMCDLLVAETTCDGKKKMYELLAHRHPMHVMELPQKPEEDAAFTHWLAELRKLRKRLEQQFGTRIGDDKLSAAIKLMNRERTLRRRLAELMKSETPPLTGCELLNMKSLIPCIPADLEQYEKAVALLPGRNLDPPAAKRPRILLTGVPMPHGAEWVIELIETCGGLVVCQENCTGLKPLLDNIDTDTADPLRAIAEKYFHLPCSVMTRNDRRFDLIRQLAAEYRADAVIDVNWQTCLTYAVETCFVRELAEKELKIPYLHIETDYSQADAARLAIRIEALFETLSDREKRVSGNKAPAR